MAVNEFFGWVWILVGMFSGAALGMGFQREDFLGGYTSRRRRLIRLGHISFFGLGILNVLFAFSLARVDGALGVGWATAAKACMVVGGIAMPVCCGVVAWRERLKLVFSVPIVCLTFGVEVLLTGMVIA